MLQRIRACRSLIAPFLFSVGVAACSENEAADDREPEFPDWPSYGRDANNSRYDAAEKKISVDTVSKLVPKWSYDAVAVTGTPALYGGMLYFGDWNSEVHAVDPRSGEEKWSIDLADDTIPNQINHTPFVTEDTVYVGAHGAKFFAIDRLTGEKRWEQTLDDQVFLMLWSSPVKIGDLIVLGIGSYQVFIPAEPPFRGKVIAIDARTGDQRWALPLTEGSGVSVWSSAAVDTGRKLLFIGTGQEYAGGPDSPYSDSLIAINYETGKLAWANQFTAGDRFQSGKAYGLDHDVGASPNLFEADGRALVGVGDKSGKYYAVDRDTGLEAWRTDLTPGGPNGGVMASTVYANGKIYVVSNSGGGTAGVGGGPGAAVVFALDTTTGAIDWQVPVQPGTFGALAAANGVLFVPTLAGQLRAFDVRNGGQLWSYDLGQSMGGGVSISGGMVFAGHGWAWIPNGVVAGGLVAFGLP